MLLKTQLANGRRAQRGSILEEHGARHRSLAPRTSSTFVTCEDRVLGKLGGRAHQTAPKSFCRDVNLDETGYRETYAGIRGKRVLNKKKVVSELGRQPFKSWLPIRYLSVAFRGSI